jgi:hypothetical protein
MSKARRNAQERVARYRHRASAKGRRRLELVIPEGDTELLKNLATALRGGGATAENARRALRSIDKSGDAEGVRTGRDLIEFFRNSPLFGEHELFSRDWKPE